MTRPGFAFVLAGIALVALAACTAPVTQNASTTQAGDVEAASDAQAAQPQSPRRIRMPPLGGPLPPERVGPDRSCRTDADCTVKDIGNCCGTPAPACVNRNAQVDPAAVRAQCGDTRNVALCAAPLIDSCRCDAGRCVDVPPAIEPSQDPPEPVR